jgi:hypothetical protein
LPIGRWEFAPSRDQPRTAIVEREYQFLEQFEAKHTVDPLAERQFWRLDPAKRETSQLQRA